MSKQIGNMYHPVNKVTTQIYEGFNWPCLFFGFLWFCVKNMWLWAIVHFILCSFTAGVAWFLFPFFVNKMHRKHLESKGYLLDQNMQPAGGNNSHLDTVLQKQQPVAPIAPVIPPPTSAEQVQPDPQPTEVVNQTESIFPQSSKFVFAKVESRILGWKNEYVIIDAETGDIVIGCREGELGTGQKILRQGQGSMASKFEVSYVTPKAQLLFQIKGGGFGGGGLEIFSPQGTVIGSLKKSGMTIFKYDAFNAAGQKVFTRAAKGLGTLASTFNFLVKGNIIASINDCLDKDDARKVMGNNFSKIQEMELDFVYSLTIQDSVSENTKIMMLASFYQLAHHAGVI